MSYGHIVFGQRFSNSEVSMSLFTGVCPMNLRVLPIGALYSELCFESFIFGTPNLVLTMFWYSNLRFARSLSISDEEILAIAFVSLLWLRISSFIKFIAKCI